MKIYIVSWNGLTKVVSDINCWIFMTPASAQTTRSINVNLARAIFYPHVYVCVCVCVRVRVGLFCGCGLRCPRATKVWSYQANDITKHFTKLITSSCRILTTSCEQIYVTSPALRLQCYIVAYMLHICSSNLKYCTYGFLDTKLWK